MLIRFNSITKPEVYSMYRTVYHTICAHIDGLNFAIEHNERQYNVAHYADKLFKYTFVFEGYIDCLFDLRIINDMEYLSFNEFVKSTRYEANFYIM